MKKQTYSKKLSRHPATTQPPSSFEENAVIQEHDIFLEALIQQEMTARAHQAEKHRMAERGSDIRREGEVRG